MFKKGSVKDLKPVVTSQEAILDTCRKMVTTEGLSAINMRSVAKACGVAVGSLYNYFPSKGSLMQATVRSVWMHDIFGIFRMDVFSYAVGAKQLSGIFDHPCSQFHGGYACRRTKRDSILHICGLLCCMYSKMIQRYAQMHLMIRFPEKNWWTCAFPV